MEAERVYICDTCEAEVYDSECHIYAESIECDSCYDKDSKEFDIAHASDLAIMARYPNLWADVKQQKRDPVGFYLACKNAILDVC